MTSPVPDRNTANLSPTSQLRENIVVGALKESWPTDIASIICISRRCLLRYRVPSRMDDGSPSPGLFELVRIRTDAKADEYGASSPLKTTNATTKSSTAAGVDFDSSTRTNEEGAAAAAAADGVGSGSGNSPSSSSNSDYETNVAAAPNLVQTEVVAAVSSAALSPNLPAFSSLHHFRVPLPSALQAASPHTASADVQQQQAAAAASASGRNSNDDADHHHHGTSSSSSGSGTNNISALGGIDSIDHNIMHLVAKMLNDHDEETEPCPDELNRVRPPTASRDRVFAIAQDGRSFAILSVSAPPLKPRKAQPMRIQFFDTVKQGVNPDQDIEDKDTAKAVKASQKNTTEALDDLLEHRNAPCDPPLLLRRTGAFPFPVSCAAMFVLSYTDMGGLSEAYRRSGASAPVVGPLPFPTDASMSRCMKELCRMPVMCLRQKHCCLCYSRETGDFVVLEMTALSSDDVSVAGRAVVASGNLGAHWTSVVWAGPLCRGSSFARSGNFRPRTVYRVRFFCYDSNSGESSMETVTLPCEALAGNSTNSNINNQQQQQQGSSSSPAAAAGRRRGSSSYHHQQTLSSAGGNTTSSSGVFSSPKPGSKIRTRRRSTITKIQRVEESNHVVRQQSSLATPFSISGQRMCIMMTVANDTVYLPLDAFDDQQSLQLSCSAASSSSRLTATSTVPWMRFYEVASRVSSDAWIKQEEAEGGAAGSAAAGSGETSPPPPAAAPSTTTPPTSRSTTPQHSARRRRCSSAERRRRPTALIAQAIMQEKVFTVPELEWSRFVTVHERYVDGGNYDEVLCYSSARGCAWVSRVPYEDRWHVKALEERLTADLEADEHEDEEIMQEILAMSNTTSESFRVQRSSRRSSAAAAGAGGAEEEDAAAASSQQHDAAGRGKNDLRHGDDQDDMTRQHLGDDRHDSRRRGGAGGRRYDSSSSRRGGHQQTRRGDGTMNDDTAGSRSGGREGSSRATRRYDSRGRPIRDHNQYQHPHQRSTTGSNSPPPHRGSAGTGGPHPPTSSRSSYHHGRRHLDYSGGRPSTEPGRRGGGSGGGAAYTYGADRADGRGRSPKSAAFAGSRHGDAGHSSSVRDSRRYNYHDHPHDDQHRYDGQEDDADRRHQRLVRPKQPSSAFAPLLFPKDRYHGGGGGMPPRPAGSSTRSAAAGASGRPGSLPRLADDDESYLIDGGGGGSAAGAGGRFASSYRQLVSSPRYSRARSAAKQRAEKVANGEQEPTPLEESKRRRKQSMAVALAEIDKLGVGEEGGDEVQDLSKIVRFMRKSEKRQNSSTSSTSRRRRRSSSAAAGAEGGQEVAASSSSSSSDDDDEEEANADETGDGSGEDGGGETKKKKKKARRPAKDTIDRKVYARAQELIESGVIDEQWIEAAFRHVNNVAIDAANTRRSNAIFNLSDETLPSMRFPLEQAEGPGAPIKRAKHTSAWTHPAGSNMRGLPPPTKREQRAARKQRERAQERLAATGTWNEEKVEHYFVNLRPREDFCKKAHKKIDKELHMMQIDVDPETGEKKHVWTEEIQERFAEHQVKMKKMQREAGPKQLDKEAKTIYAEGRDKQLEPTDYQDMVARVSEEYVERKRRMHERLRRDNDKELSKMFVPETLHDPPNSSGDTTHYGPQHKMMLVQPVQPLSPERMKAVGTRLSDDSVKKKEAHMNELFVDLEEERKVHTSEWGKRFLDAQNRPLSLEEQKEMADRLSVPVSRVAAPR